MMKRIAILSLVFLCCANLAVSGEKGRTGLRFGLGITNVFGSDADLEGYDRSSELGIYFGGHVTYLFTPRLAIQPELSMERKGVKYTSDDLTITARYEYFQLGLFARASVLPSLATDPYVYVGPVYGFSLSARWKGDTETLASSIEIPGRKSEFSLVGGAGIRIQLNSWSELLVEARIGSALTNVAEDLASRNQVAMFAIGWAYE